MSDVESDPEYTEEQLEKLIYQYERTVEKLNAFEYIKAYCVDVFKQELARVLLNYNDIFFVIRMLNVEVDRLFAENSETKERWLEMVEVCVPLFRDWIIFIDGNVFTSENSNVRAVDFLHLTVLNYRGRIDYGLTARSLLAETNISMVDKLKIACIHCLVDDIMRFTKGKNFFLRDEGVLNAPKHVKKLINFWKEMITETKYNVKDAEILIHKIGYENYDGLKLLWNKLMPIQKNRVMSKIFQRTKSGLHCWWLNELTAKQQQLVMRRCGVYVLISMMDQNWNLYFFETAYFAKDILSSKQYLEVIKATVSRIQMSNEIIFNVFVQMFHFMWRLAPKRTKEYMYQQEDALSFFDYMKKNRDFDFFEKFFVQAPLEYRRKFLDTKIGQEICLHMTDHLHDFDLVHNIIALAYPQPEEAFRYKIKMMNCDLGLHVMNLMMIGNEQLYDKKLITMFLTREYVNEYKKLCLNGHQIRGILNETIRLTFFTDRIKTDLRPELDFNRITKFMRQYVIDREIDTYKKNELCKSRDVVEVLLLVIKMNRYDLVDEFLKWSFDDNHLVANYKRNFYIDRSKCEFVEMIAALVLKKDNLKALKKFGNWCSMAKEKHRQLSDVILTSTKEAEKTLMPMWRYLLLKDDNFASTEHFFKLCGYVTKQDLQDAKKKIFAEMNWLYLVFGVWNRWSIDDDLNNRKTLTAVKNKCQSILRWFNENPKTFEDLTESGLFVDDYGNLIEFFKLFISN